MNSSSWCCMTATGNDKYTCQIVNDQVLLATDGPRSSSFNSATNLSGASRGEGGEKSSYIELVPAATAAYIQVFHKRWQQHIQIKKLNSFSQCK